MKKIICIIIIIGFILTFFSEISIATEVNDQESIAGKIIRFHVIANSDEQKDQDLKLQVKNKVLSKLYPILQKSGSINQSRNILIKESNNIKKQAEAVIKENGFNYSVKVMLSYENFPIKSYGNITLPQGKYEAFRIIIGNGKGKNWWCVMFPPLCFIDITKGQISIEKTEEVMKGVLTDKEFKAVDSICKPIEKIANNSILNTNKINGKKIIVKFKLLEVIEKIFENKKS